MSLTPYFVPHVPGLPGASVEQPDLTSTERRWRRAGAALLATLAVGTGAGVVAVQVGALPASLLAGALAVAFAMSLLAAVSLDVAVTVRRPRGGDGVRPGLRAASFCYLAALLCLGVTFAFLAT